VFIVASGALGIDVTCFIDSGVHETPYRAFSF